MYERPVIISLAVPKLELPSFAYQTIFPEFLAVTTMSKSPSPSISKDTIKVAASRLSITVLVKDSEPLLS